MVELLEVEDRRARADALEREAFDELRDAHDLGAIVVAPAEEREEVDERLGEVALGAELLDRGCTVALRELLAVGAEDVGDVPVPRERGAESLEDLDLLRRVRDVVVAAQDERDPVQPVLDR